MSKKWNINRRKSPAQIRQQALAQSMRALSGAIGGLQSAAHGLRQCILHTELDFNDIRHTLLRFQVEDIQAAARRLQAEYKLLEERNRTIKEFNVAERKAKKKLPSTPSDQD